MHDFISNYPLARICQRPDTVVADMANVSSPAGSLVHYAVVIWK
jgi:hypothetical protein